MQQATTNEPGSLVTNPRDRDCGDDVRQQSDSSLGSFRILRLVVKINECNSAYNQFTLPLRGQYQTTICTFYKTKMSTADDVTVLDGDGSIGGFLKNVNEVLKNQDFDAIHAHSPHVACLFLLRNLFKPARMARTIMTAHNSYQNFKLRNRFLLLAPFLFFRHVAICGVAAAESFPWLYRLLAGRRLRAVTNGVNLARVKQCINQVSARDKSDGLFHVVSVGRLVPIKCPVTVLDAFHRAADENARLTYFGDGNLRSIVETEIDRLNANSQVELTGIIPRDDLLRRIYHSDLFISASRGEGLPIAVLEAMACGCPVVLSDIPPHREIAADTEFIPLVPVDDVLGFSREIERFQAMSPKERTAIGSRCQELVEQRFSVEAMHQGYDRLYAELKAGNRT